MFFSWATRAWRASASASVFLKDPPQNQKPKTKNEINRRRRRALRLGRLPRPPVLGRVRGDPRKVRHRHDARLRLWPGGRGLRARVGFWVARQHRRGGAAVQERLRAEVDRLLVREPLFFGGGRKSSNKIQMKRDARRRAVARSAKNSLNKKRPNIFPSVSVCRASFAYSRPHPKKAREEIVPNHRMNMPKTSASSPTTSSTLNSAPNERTARRKRRGAPFSGGGSCTPKSTLLSRLPVSR